MSTWTYCLDCTKPLPMPSFVDAACGVQWCSHCRTPRGLDDHDRRFVLDQAAEALHALSEMAAQAAESHGRDRTEWERFAALFAQPD